MNAAEPATGNVRRENAKHIFLFILLTAFTLGAFIHALIIREHTLSQLFAHGLENTIIYNYIITLVGGVFLMNKRIAGLGLIFIVVFSAYFSDFVDLHNYMSVALYGFAFADICIRKTRLRLFFAIPLVIFGTVQGIDFLNEQLFVLYFEVLSFLLYSAWNLSLLRLNPNRIGERLSR